MAEYLIQDTTLTEIADAIRAKEGSSSEIPVSKLASRISAISAGTEVQKKSGYFTTDRDGLAEVDCGFIPDVVSIAQGTSGGFNQDAVAFLFLEYGEKEIAAYMDVDILNNERDLCKFDVSRDSWNKEESPEYWAIGFVVTVWRTYGYTDEPHDEEFQNATFQYTAYKFT